MVISWIILFSLRTAMNRTSVQWLFVKWAAAGRPAIPHLEWDVLVKKVGVMIEREVMH